MLLSNKKYVVLLLLLSSISLWGRDPYIEQELQRLNDLKARGRISSERYNFFYSLLTEEEEERLYTLTINGKRATEAYQLKFENGESYYPLLSFFNSIGHSQIEKTPDKIVIQLENDQDRVIIDLKSKEIEDRRHKNFPIVEKVDYFLENDELYLKENLFQKLFLESPPTKNEEELKIDFKPAFTTKEYQFMQLEIEEEKFLAQADFKEVTHTNPRKFWELGYLRANALLIKEKKMSNEWSNFIEYQGSFLYGTLVTGYDLNTGEWNDASIRYRDIWKQHDLDFWRYSNNEKGISFKKKKGYFWNGNKYVIHEDVPIGSTVELLYMGSVIAIQNAQDGEVTFSNSEIMENRTYTLKIYTPSGDILVRTIQTHKDYNQQKKGQVEYNFDIREQKWRGDKYKTNLEVFYGLTNTLTLGAQYMKSPELSEKNEWKYLDESQLELIYSDRIKTYPYTFSAGYGKALNLYKNKSSYDFLGQIDINKWSISAELEEFGYYYNQKRTRNFEVIYDATERCSVGYEYLYQENYEADTTEEHRLKFSLSHSYKELLTTLNYNMSSLNSYNEFNLNLYYGGFRNFAVIFNNGWKDLFKEYETKLVISNTRYYGPIDAALEIKYSEKYKGTFSFKFEMKLDDWFKFGFTGNKDGGRSVAVGIDRTFDLQNIRKSVESIDSSRLKVITFEDCNGNGVYDEGDKSIPFVEVSVGSQTEITDKDGIAYFYGVPNNIRYNLQVSSPVPNHTLGKIKYSVLGKDNSTIEAFIPIQTYGDIYGQLKFSDNVKLSSEAKEELLSNFLIEVKDSKGKLVERTTFDETGDFGVHSLFDKKYNISISYRGDDYEIPNFNETIEIGEKPFNFVFDGKNILLREELKQNEI
jgi:hypothetical protein